MIRIKYYRKFEKSILNSLNILKINENSHEKMNKHFM